MKLLIIALFSSIVLVSCTEEKRNQLLRSVQQNIVGERLKVSYVDYGKIVKSWIISDGKVTTGVTEEGQIKGYYFFYSTDGYVQIPVDKAMIEELRD